MIRIPAETEAEFVGDRRKSRARRAAAVTVANGASRAPAFRSEPSGATQISTGFWANPATVDARTRDASAVRSAAIFTRLLSHFEPLDFQRESVEARLLFRKMHSQSGFVMLPAKPAA